MRVTKFLKLSRKNKKRKVKTLFFNLFLYNKYKNNIKTKLENGNFTIISNNCFAGSIYQDLDLVYKTPTVGLFFYSDCYMKFVKNLKYYLSLDLEFTNKSKYEMTTNSPETIYPIGILDDIEIHFLHYSSENEAKEKWGKRKTRINFDNIFYVFSDRDGFSDRNFEDFLNFNNKKVLFTSKEKYKSKDTVILKEFVEEDQIGEITLNKWMYTNEFDISDFLNNSNLGV